MIFFFFKASTIGPLTEINLFWVHRGEAFPQEHFRALWGRVWLSGRQGFGLVEVGTVFHSQRHSWS